MIVQIRFCYLVVQLNQLSVVHAGFSSLGRHVDDDAHVALVLVQFDVVAIDIDGGEVVDRAHALGVRRILSLE